MAKCGDCIQQYEKSKQRLRKAAAKKREAAQLEKPQPVQYQIRSADRFIPPGTNLTDLLNVLRLQQTMAGAANNPQTLTPSLERQRIPTPRVEIETPTPAIIETPQFQFITEQRTFPVAQIGGRAVLGQALLDAAGSGGQALLDAADSGGRALAGAAGLGGRALVGTAGLGGRALVGAADLGGRALAGAAGLGGQAVLGTADLGGRALVGAAGLGGQAVLGAAGLGGRALVGAAGLGGQAVLGAAGLGGRALVGAAGLGGQALLGTINFIGDAVDSAYLERSGRALATEAQPERDPQPPPRFFESPVVPPSMVDDLAARRVANPLPQPPTPLPLLPETETPLPERTVLDLMEREPDPGLVPAPAVVAPVGDIQLLPEQPEEELDEFYDSEEAPYEAQPKEEEAEDALPEDERPRQAQPDEEQPEEEQAEMPLEVYERPTFTAASLASGGGEVIPAETAESLTRPRTAAQLEGDLKKSEAAERKRAERGELIRKYGTEMHALGFIKNGDYDIKRYIKEREAANREGFLKENGEPDVEAYQNRQAEEFDELLAAGAAADVRPFK